MDSSNLEYERRNGYPRALVAGVDEVGRGCLAGPVVAAAVLLPADPQLEKLSWISEISDSKELSPATREKLVPLIEAWAASYAIGVASVEEIDRINIYHATHAAMIRAVEQLSKRPDHVLVDGNVVPKALRVPASAVVKGDLKCLSIGAASILAKVWRDRLMIDMEARYPGYGFGVHKGYGTPAHQVALKSLGACAIHRKTFAPVAAVIGKAQLSLL